eukprot:GEMP01021790.1.p1 GENE.GEMP01021790.1~~GEMP01021790.1.p1  ORF type:complete len:298 (+),score=67.69 GEMP01021790.1:238-1131(+)
MAIDPSKTIVTCALTGTFTDPTQFPVPVTPKEMADEARAAYDAGACMVHCHFRQQEPGKGHLPCWDAAVAGEICDLIRQRCPGIMINMSTGVIGNDISAQVACLKRVKPEMAACNAGSLNYLKLTSKDQWAWPPILFDNPVEKVKRFADEMHAIDCVPECECFDTGIVRSVGLFARNGILHNPPHISLVMGVQSGMPCKKEWLPLLVKEMPVGAHWQSICIGRAEIWDVQRETARLGGHLRTGLEDTFYLPDGSRAKSNGELIAALVKIAKEEGRSIATPDEARVMIRSQHPQRANL